MMEKPETAKQRCRCRLKVRAGRGRVRSVTPALTLGWPDTGEYSALVTTRAY